MMKKLTLLFLIIFATIIVHAQKKQNVYFLKNSGKEVKLKDSADYVRIIEEPDSGEKYFNIKEFYQNGNKKLLGEVSAFEPKIIYEGVVISYFKNGKSKSSINYKKDSPVGPAFYFFENGKVKKQLEYLGKDSLEKKSANKSLEPKFKLIYQVDSLGQVYVKDGNGHLIDTAKSDGDKLVEEGDYKDGFKDGVWKGKYLSGKSNYVESYADHKFVSGINTVGDQKIEYTILEKAPEFKGGIQAFYNYLGRSIKYPKEAYTNGITGSVIVNFTVEKDGKISEAKIDKPFFPSIDQEAIRVIMTSPAWIAGMQRGVPVRVKYNIPIKFALR
ncbi:MAG: TonB family protein [Pedobacter sp.]|nr:MAG: TonB family protein [Pedobacter sp.]